MKHLSRTELMTDLQERYPNCWFKPGEEFDEGYGDRTIWTGEGSEIYDEEYRGIPAFDMEWYPETYGVYPSLYEFIKEHGYEVEWYDGGTVFICPV